MNFFEAWGKRAGEKGDLSIGCDIGIHAAKQALKEMMVGEPLLFSVKHIKSELYPSDIVTFLDGRVFWYGEHGTDGEEVVVMVFKKP